MALPRTPDGAGAPDSTLHCQGCQQGELHWDAVHAPAASVAQVCHANARLVLRMRARGPGRLRRCSRPLQQVAGSPVGSALRPSGPGEFKEWRGARPAVDGSKHAYAWPGVVLQAMSLHLVGRVHARPPCSRQVVRRCVMCEAGSAAGDYWLAVGAELLC